MRTEETSTHQKARRINLDALNHGTFAEIGAGQEVARWFFHVGGAAATVAKSISAYDMAVSDALYGPSDRYVSRRRLQSMLDREYEELQRQLAPRRGGATAFFVFADTVAARSFTRQEEGHGWMGVRFQHVPHATPSEIIIHARLLDAENLREQEALGILGVNLLYGALYHHGEPVTLIRSLMEDLTRERIEIDMIRLDGPVFSGVDNRLMSLQLVEQGFTDAAMFTASGEVAEPAELLHGKPVVVERGSFRPITKTTMDMLERSAIQFRAGLPEGSAPPAVLMEMWLRNLTTGDQVDHADFLARVDVLGALGQNVMISRFTTYHPLPAYLRRYTPGPLLFPMGISILRELLDERYYTDLDGGILEAFGRLFKAGVTLAVYPQRDPATGNLVTVETLAVPSLLTHLYAHLLEHRMIQSIRVTDETELTIMPQEVLRRMRAGDATWETLVPAAAVRLIKQRGLFGYGGAPAPPTGASN